MQLFIRWVAVLGLCFFINSLLLAQQSTFVIPENNYSSSTNSYYWKNKLPYAGYWQQDVHYVMDVVLDDTNHVLKSKYYALTYSNNSPDTLRELYFHIYQDAFRPNSYYHELNKVNDVNVKFGEKELLGLTTQYEDVKVNGVDVKTIQDNTVFKVVLNEPLYPSQQLVVTMNFSSWFDTGSMRRRMKTYTEFGYKHFDAVHWYPTICVYDMHSGWDTDQHLDKEFYNNFGTFDVQLSLPQEYILDGTGIITNYEEVYPDTLMQKINLSNFAKKPYNEAPSMIIPRVHGAMKTWRFHAENVHNFAFTADPTYRIGKLTWKGIDVITLAQEHHAASWQQSGEFTRRVIEVYSRDFGQYAWPKIIVADAKDGMEYPMLTLNGGTYPQHQGLLAHEVGHMWFYGMLGSNETYRAFLDEGLTQFLTVWSQEAIAGPYRKYNYKSSILNKHTEPFTLYSTNAYLPYLSHVKEKYDEPLSTHSCDFNSAIRHGGNYGLVYYKTAVMMYHLQQVLGDAMFRKCIQHYVQKWSMAHPYPEDFRKAFIEASGTDLNWFFDEWLDTRKALDYGIKKIHKQKHQENYEYTIQLERKGEMQSSCDVEVMMKDSSVYRYHIPNTWFQKKTNDSILNKWYGWGWLNPTYDIHVTSPQKMKYVRVNHYFHQTDTDLSNNYKGRSGFTKFKFDYRVPAIPTAENRYVYWRPDVWYQQQDGLMLGLHTHGSYFKKCDFSATVWANSQVGQVLPEYYTTSNQPLAWNLSLQRNLSQFGKEMSLKTVFSYNAGIWNTHMNLEKIFRKQDQRVRNYTLLGVQVKYLMNDLSTYDYQWYRNWGKGVDQQNAIHSYVNPYIMRKYYYGKGYGTMAIHLRTPFIASQYNYYLLSLESKNTFTWHKFDMSSRIFVQAATQTIPFESSVFLAGDTPENMVENKFNRTATFFPTGMNTFMYHPGGSMNLRAYVGEKLSTQVNHGNDSLTHVAYGASGVAWNGEFDIDKYLYKQTKEHILHLDVYAFVDAGLIQTSRSDVFETTQVLANAGLGSALKIKFGEYDIKPLVIRLDCPMWMSDRSLNIGSKFILGINRSF